VCAAALSHTEILALQGGLLPAAITRDIGFKIARRYGRHDWHIEMLGPYPNQAYCGVLFTKSGKGAEWEKKQKTFAALQASEDLCPNCRSIFTVKLNEVSRAEVV
jgi:hypothetical protein